MIFEPALLSDFVSSGREALAGESDLCTYSFSSWTHSTWILGEELGHDIRATKWIFAAQACLVRNDSEERLGCC